MSMYVVVRNSNQIVIAFELKDEAEEYIKSSPELEIVKCPVVWGSHSKPNPFERVHNPVLPTTPTSLELPDVTLNYAPFATWHE